MFRVCQEKIVSIKAEKSDLASQKGESNPFDGARIIPGYLL